MAIRSYTLPTPAAFLNVAKMMHEALGYLHNFVPSEMSGTTWFRESQVRYSPAGHNHNGVGSTLVHYDAIHKQAFDLNSVQTLWGSYFNTDQGLTTYALFSGSTIRALADFHAGSSGYYYEIFPISTDPTLTLGAMSQDSHIDVWTNSNNNYMRGISGTIWNSWTAVTFHATATYVDDVSGGSTNYFSAPKVVAIYLCTVASAFNIGIVLDSVPTSDICVEWMVVCRGSMVNIL